MGFLQVGISGYEEQSGEQYHQTLNRGANQIPHSVLEGLEGATGFVSCCNLCDRVLRLTHPL